VLITDHNVRETLGLIDRAYIIHSGRVLTEGRRTRSSNTRTREGFTWGRIFGCEGAAEESFCERWFSEGKCRKMSPAAPSQSFLAVVLAM